MNRHYKSFTKSLPLPSAHLAIISGPSTSIPHPSRSQKWQRLTLHFRSKCKCNTIHGELGSRGTSHEPTRSWRKGEEHGVRYVMDGVMTKAIRVGSLPTSRLRRCDGMESETLPILQPRNYEDLRNVVSVKRTPQTLSTTLQCPSPLPPLWMLKLYSNILQFSHFLFQFFLEFDTKSTFFTSIPNTEDMLKHHEESLSLYA